MDIEALIAKVEEAHHADIQQVYVEIQEVSERLEAGEVRVSSLEERVSVMKKEEHIEMVLEISD